jgi:hypothetical protein
MPGEAVMSEIRSAIGEKLLGCAIELSDALEQQAEDQAEQTTA